MAEILFEDKDIIVVKKPAGVESQRGKSFAMDLESELRNKLSRELGKANPYLAVVHRLDRPVTGVMVYAKTKAAAADLSRQFANGIAHKRYEALVRLPDEERSFLTETKETELRNYLLFDKKNNKSVVISGHTADPAAKEAVLRYRLYDAKQSGLFSLSDAGMDRMSLKIAGKTAGTIAKNDITQLAAASIHLFTGRHHQIRVQLANAGYPIVGDTRYGESREGVLLRGSIALCAAELSFFHPVSKKQLQFSLDMS